MSLNDADKKLVETLTSTADYNNVGLESVRLIQRRTLLEAIERITALSAEVERLNQILGRIVACDGDSNLVIRVGTDAFAAAREYCGLTPELSRAALGEGLEETKT